MDRRGFLKLFGGAAAAGVAAPLIPFNRVWSFPKNIVIAKTFADFEIGDMVTIEHCSVPLTVTRVFPDRVLLRPFVPHVSKIHWYTRDDIYRLKRLAES